MSYPTPSGEFVEGGRRVLASRPGEAVEDFLLRVGVPPAYAVRLVPVTADPDGRTIALDAGPRLMRTGPGSFYDEIPPRDASPEPGLAVAGIGELHLDSWHGAIGHQHRRHRSWPLPTGTIDRALAADVAGAAREALQVAPDAEVRAVARPIFTPDRTRIEAAAEPQGCVAGFATITGTALGVIAGIVASILVAGASGLPVIAAGSVAGLVATLLAGVVALNLAIDGVRAVVAWRDPGPVAQLRAVSSRLMAPIVLLIGLGIPVVSGPVAAAIVAAWLSGS